MRPQVDRDKIAEAAPFAREHTLHRPSAVRTGEATPDHLSSDTDAGSVTDVDRAFVAGVTPFTAMGEINRHEDSSSSRLALAPTPRVEISAGLAIERGPTTGRILGGRYRLGRQLGQGGYGAVFSGEDTITGERVAIKVLSPAASRQHELIIRFHREAIAASRARHPHIVTIVDFDIDGDDEHFIVMEHLDGRDLAQTLADARPLSPVRALTIAAQVARGLAASHQVGVMHRDLKPANVFLVRRDDGRETVKVIDFGISKLTPLAGDYTDVTSGSKVVGTPSYMSPEQARGAPLDARTDVYALGVMLFEMLVGERPFLGRSPIEILGNHFSAPRVAPSAHRAELADYEGLDAIVLRAIASEPAQRFASMEELGEALDACLRTITPANNRLVTSPVARSTPPSRWLVGLAALIVAVIAIASWIVLRPSPAKQTPGSNTPAPKLSVEKPPIAEPPAPAPVVRSVRVTSSPSGAIVYRDDERIGVTPLTLELDDSEHVFEVEAAGYRGRRVSIGPDRDQLNVVLSPIRARPAPPPAPAGSRGVAEW
jgi:serine/threonine-protein kinase